MTTKIFYFIFIMPDYNYSIFKLIRIKNGLEALRLARSFERETLAIARFKSHLNFNHRLKENRVLPDSLRFNPPIKRRRVRHCQESGSRLLEITHKKLSYPDSPTPLQAGEVSIRSPANSGRTQHGRADAHRRTHSHF